MGNTTSYRSQLPEKWEMCLQAGINLFELAKNHQNYQGMKDFGYFNVDVRDSIVGSPPRVTYHPYWHRGPTSYITYIPNHRGFCFAMCPDDSEWYNRMQLASNIHSGFFRIDRYHTRNGIVSGERMTEEINLIRTLTHNWILKVNGEIKEYAAVDKRFMLEQEEKRIKERDPSAITQILWGKTKEIQDLITRYRNNWFFSAEFSQKIKPRIAQEVADHFGATTEVAANEETLVNLLKSLGTEGVKSAIMKAFPDMRPANEVDTQPEGDNVLGSVDLAAIKDPKKLRKIGKKLGIEFPPRTKPEDMIQQITEEHARRSMEQTPEVPTGNPDNGMSDSDDRYRTGMEEDGSEIVDV